MDEATKDEVQKLLAQLTPAPKSRFSRLFLKIGVGYVAVAIVTTTALLFSVYNLYAVSSTARQIANTDLPVLTALVRMRSSLLAQEGFAGKYSILKDATFIDLFRQRREDTVADLAVLERTKSVSDIASLKRLYLAYNRASESLFAGKTGNRKELRASALRLLAALDALYIERQGMLQAVLKRAHEQQKATFRWIIVISSAGFLLTIFLAPLIIHRVIRALRTLQKETHRIASGDLNYTPQVPAVAEISDLADDFNEMAAKIKEMEQRNLDALPLTRLPGNLAIERVLNERLKSGTPFAFCRITLDNFHEFVAQHGYAKAGELLHETGVLVHSAVAGNGAPGDFAGHAGGDNFVMVVSTDRVIPVCEAVVKSFDAKIMKEFAAEDRGAGPSDGGYCDNLQRVFPPTTVSICVLDCSVEVYASAVEIARAAVDVKDSQKKASGSGWQRATRSADKGELL